jgi:8-oxo-dGTP pyrophosphatase MutT (NUDIX family)
MSELIPAATVIVQRQSQHGVEALLLNRNKALNFAPGLWVFPGGRVDPAELALPADALEQARMAAIRECEEEAGVYLNSEQLTPFAHWTAPEGSPKRFSTWFFIATVNDDVEIVIDDGEIVDYQWLPLADALQQHRAGSLPMLPPTYICLSQMCRFEQTQQITNFAENRGMIYYQPQLVIEGDKLCFLYEEDACYNTSRLANTGVEHRCWMVDSICDYIDGAPLSLAID